MLLRARAIALLFVAACSSDDPPGRRENQPAAPNEETKAAARAIAAYRTVEVQRGGRIDGIVRVTDSRRSEIDTVPLVSTSQAECRDDVTPERTDRRGDSVTGVLVWLEDIRAGKPLSLARRYTLRHYRCELHPLVQPALIGGTLNVLNADSIGHRTRFIRAGSGRVLDVVRQTDAGQLVPTEEVLQRSGRVEIRCDVHPWTRGWIQVFDHPYFAVSNSDGRFAIDSVPPGRYRLVAWHPRLGTREQTVNVQADGEPRPTIEY